MMSSFKHNSTGPASSDKTGGQYLLKVSVFAWVIKCEMYS